MYCPSRLNYGDYINVCLHKKESVSYILHDKLCDHLGTEDQCQLCIDALEEKRLLGIMKCDKCSVEIGDDNEVTRNKDYFEISRKHSYTPDKVCKKCYLTHLERKVGQEKKDLSNEIEHAIIDYYLIPDSGRNIRIIDQFNTIHGGYKRGSREDLIIINTYPCKFYIAAIEIKVTRQDFLGDVKNFCDKHKDAMEFCNKFYYACPKGIIKINELPENIGLMEYENNDIRENNIRIRKQAKHIMKGDIKREYLLSFLTRMPHLSYMMRSWQGKDYLIINKGL